MINCKVFYCHDAHVSRILTGFYLLEKAGIICPEFIDNSSNICHVPGRQVVEVRIEGKIIAFDVGDRWALYDDIGRNYLDHVDGYFARDYSDTKDIVTPILFTDNPKVKPFGLYYYATYPGNPMENGHCLSTSERIRKWIRKQLKYDRCFYPEYVEGAAEYKTKNLKILFMTRLWDENELSLPDNPDESTKEYYFFMKNERREINECRMELIRRLKEKFGSAFIGGIYPDSLANKMCPDLVLPFASVRKKAYLDRMKKSDICIGSKGLHKSVQWKIGEYVAAARAIVMQKPQYTIPGGFTDGKNYCSFETPDQCLEMVEKLYQNPMAVYQMKKENEVYYQAFVRPDIQILNALREMDIRW